MYKKEARIIAALFLMSTLGMVFGSSIINDLRAAPDYISLIAESRVQLINGILLVLMNNFCVVGIAVVFFPILRRFNPTVSVGYLSFRIVEGVILTFGAISLISLLTLGEQYAKAVDPAITDFNLLGVIFGNMNYYAFQIAMIALAIGSFLLCYILYQSKLIPRLLTLFGLIGYLSMLVKVTLDLYGIDSGGDYLFIPGGIFEVLLPIWLVVKGFDQQALLKVAARNREGN